MPPAFEGVEAQLRRATRVFRDVKPRTRYEAALLAHYAAACDTARGVVTLADHAHGELALGAARVGFEQTVSAYWLAIEPEPRAEQYEQFTLWEDHKMLELLGSLAVPPPIPVADVEKLAREKKAASAHFRGRLGWTQRNLPDRCADVCSRWTQPYAITRLPRFQRLATTLGNRGAHPSAKDAAGRLEARPDFTVRLGPHRLTYSFSAKSIEVRCFHSNFAARRSRYLSADVAAKATKKVVGLVNGGAEDRASDGGSSANARSTPSAKKPPAVARSIRRAPPTLAERRRSGRRNSRTRVTA
jgi:hypothetical protein